MKKDYQNFDIKLNMKTILLFEQLSGKSFYTLSPDDMFQLIYSSLIVNNNIMLTFSQFELVMKNPKISSTLLTKCQDELNFISQFNKQEDDNTSTEGGEVTKLTDVINSLILNNNIDIQYVMYDMRLWEIPMLIKSIDDKIKNDMMEKRFWTYLNICPHIDGKKIKSPEQLFPFPWEKENKKNQSIKFMEENREHINNFFKKHIKQDE